MVDTFRGRDPRTGGTIISDRTRVPDGGGLTQRERDAFAGTGEFNRGAMQSVNRPSGAMSYQEFLSSTGRSDTDSFGNTGRLKNLNPNYTKTTPGGAATIRMGNELAYDKYLNPRTDGQLRPFRPNDLIFEQGITQIARPAPSQGGIMGLSPTVALLKSLFGIGGVQFEPLVDADPLDNPAAAPPAPVEAPIPAASTVGAQQPSGFILASTMPREDNGIFNLPLDQLRKIPETGIGGFIEQSKDGFQIGPGKLKPEFNVNDGSFGLTFKIPISSQSVPDGGVTTPDGMNPFRDILRTPVINPDVPSNMPVISGENIEEYRNRPLPGQERPMTPKMRDIFRFKSQFPAGV